MPNSIPTGSPTKKSSPISPSAPSTRGSTDDGRQRGTVTVPSPTAAKPAANGPAEKSTEDVSFDLTIGFFGADKLPDMDAGGGADPYFIAELGGLKYM